MSILETAAEFLISRQLLNQAAARSERIKLHVVDTLGALIAGEALEDTAPLHDLAPRDPLVCACAAARSTEVDDIHLCSCSTPGSVIVPVALHLVASGLLESWQHFAVAVLGGYELLIRLGFAIDGPSVLARQIWPTYYAAAFGSAAVASRALQLNASQTAGALATALAFCAGTPSAAASSERSSRWLSVGIAAANGILAARAAERGLFGSPQLLERHERRIAGVDISETRLAGDLGDRYLFDGLSMKPYPVARQGLAAIEAAEELSKDENMDADSISEIVIGVPAPQLKVIDHSETPRTRLGSIVSVQYQTALALLMPEHLLDVNRTPPCVNDRIRALMTRIRVQRAPELEETYPEVWPGRVEIVTGAKRCSRTVIHPFGDSKNPFDAEAVAQKFRRLVGARLGAQAVEEVLGQIQAEASPVIWCATLPFHR